MAIKIHSGWCFNHPDFGNVETGTGLTINPNGKIAMIFGSESIRQSIILLLSTVPGERVMRPNYGCNLQKLAFLPNDATTHGLAIHFVRIALEQWEPRIDLLTVDANANPDNANVMDISLSYRVRPMQNAEHLLVAFQLMGE